MHKVKGGTKDEYIFYYHFWFTLYPEHTQCGGERYVTGSQYQVQQRGYRGNQREKDAENTSATTEFENNTSLPDEFVKTIREMAKEGAQKGVYKGDEYIAFMNAYKKQHISPDRPKLLMGLNKILSTLPRIVNRFQTFSLMGCRATVDFYSSFSTFYNSNGEKIMTCDSDGDVMEFPTKAENKFHSEMNALYEEAYDAARAEMKAAAQG